MYNRSGEVNEKSNKKKRRIKYLLIECLQNKEKKIENIGSRTNSIWVLNKDN